MKYDLYRLTRYSAVLVVAAAVAFVCAGDYTCFFERQRGLSPRELKEKGNRYLLDGHPDSAMRCYAMVQASFSERMSEEDKAEVARSYNNSGYVCFYYFNDYPQAYSYLLRSQEIGARLSIPSGQGNVYLNLGNIYANYGDVSACVSQYAKSIDVALRENKEDVYLIALMNLMSTAYMSDIPDNVRILDAELARLDTLTLKPQPMLTCARKIGEAIRLSGHGDVDRAAAAFRAALADVDSPLTPERFRINILGMLSELYNYNRRMPEATAVAKESVAISHEHGLTDLEGIALNNLAAIFKRAGRADSADYYRLKSLEISDSLFNTRTYGSIRDLQSKSDARVAAEQMSVLEQSHRMTQTIIWIVSVAGAICLILLVVVVIKSRRLRRSYEEIYRHVSKSVGMSASSPVSVQVNVSRHDEERNAQVQDTGAKYKSSPLGEVDMDALAIRITEVMETSEEIYSSDFSLDRLATLTQAKSKHISQTLGEKMGRSFSSLLSYYRVRQACRILEDPVQSRFTLEAIASDLGYKSRSHFATVFKKETGITPGEYARISRKMKSGRVAMN